MSTGLNLKLEEQHQDERDFKFGTHSLPCLAQIPEDERESYLPEGELQNIGSEKMDCATRSPINILAAKFNWLFRNKVISYPNRKWLLEKGYVLGDKVDFSDRYVSINAGTTIEGNSLKAPLEAIRKQGLIPKGVLPQVNSFSEYYDPQSITVGMSDLGLEFAERFQINYEKVYETHYSDIDDYINVAGYAWSEPKDGVYPRIDRRPNHAFAIIRRMYYIFDNYIDNGFIKHLAPDYDFYRYGYRVTINELPVKQVKLGCFKRWWLFVKPLLKCYN